MYIKSVIIDGFKSYGKRTEINGFDREFNAITGLNGTGKSNILDSICFVLGIMNLSQVRAGSMQELVFKNGQAGITKATVTLIFDNSDRNQCPLGYDKCKEISVTRQVVVGGKNKYLINGKQVQNKKVIDLFCSVQLNVNNPSFLIMQGRITKVLNMKPNEVLAMVEEAAGTSLYESKREASNKILEKKETKLVEANTLMDEEVEPRIEKLRKEQSAYVEYQKITRDMEYLTRIHISYRYLKSKESLKSAEENIAQTKSEVETYQQNMQDNDQECNDIDEKLKQIQHEIDIESGGALTKLEQDLKQFKKQEDTAKGNLDGIKSKINIDEKNLKKLEQSIKSDEDALDQKQTQMSKMDDVFRSLKEADENDERLYEEAKKKYELAIKGLSTDKDGQSNTLQGQLCVAQSKISEAKSSKLDAENSLKHWRSQLQKKERETKSADTTYVKDTQLQKQIEATIKKLEDRLNDIGYTEGTIESLMNRKGQLRDSIRQCNAELARRRSQDYALQYSEPEPNFNHSKVHGLVCRLLTSRDPSKNFSLATAAGGSMRSCIVEDDETGKKLLKNGNLANRVIFIPLNKISSRPIDERVVQFAQKLVGSENVQSAISLVDFDPHFKKAMQYVFGHSLICKDLQIAQKVTFHKNIRCRSITLDGDVVDPEGTLSGGAVAKNQIDMFQIVAEITKLEKDRNNYEAQLRQVDQEITSVQRSSVDYENMKQQLEVERASLKEVQTRLASNAFQEHQSAIEELKNKIQTFETQRSEAIETITVSEKDVKEIQSKLANSEEHKERQKKLAEKEKEQARIQAEQSHKKWAAHEKNFLKLKNDIENLQESIKKSMEERDELNANIEKKRQEMVVLAETNEQAKEEVAELTKKIKEQKDKINSQNKELKNLTHKKSILQKKNDELKIDIKKKEAAVKKLTDENKGAFDKIKQYENDYPWIIEDREFFGMKNTRYDYAKENPTKAAQKLAKLKEDKEAMERRINPKAMATLAREEEKFQHAKTRTVIVVDDKKKIKVMMDNMDITKREEVVIAWEKVNENFSNIFKTLLPGAVAKLDAVKQNGELTGLQIKVGFNDVYKESLNELSGGQRSLVALSLVLAMLKFSPAPLYILDEVDAALDMSHTQNIGQMLKKYFSSSQFIIVSLKEGMFNNANVLFRTKFEDGVSGVIRTVNPKLLAQGRK